MAHINIMSLEELASEGNRKKYIATEPSLSQHLVIETSDGFKAIGGEIITAVSVQSLENGQVIGPVRTGTMYRLPQDGDRSTVIIDIV